MKIKCNSCGTNLTCKESDQARRVKCPKCGKSIEAPAKSTTPKSTPESVMDADATPLLKELGGGTFCANCGSTSGLAECEMWAARKVTIYTRDDATMIREAEGVVTLHGVICAKCMWRIAIPRLVIIVVPTLVAAVILITMLLNEFSASAVRNRHDPVNATRMMNMMAAMCLIPTLLPLGLIAFPIAWFLWRNGGIRDCLLHDKAEKGMAALGYPHSGPGQLGGEVVKKEK